MFVLASLLAGVKDIIIFIFSIARGFFGGIFGTSGTQDSSGFVRCRNGNLFLLRGRLRRFVNHRHFERGKGFFRVVTPVFQTAGRFKQVGMSRRVICVAVVSGCF